MQNFEFDIDLSCEKKRLDIFLSEINTDLSRSYAQRLIEGDFISVNGTPARSKYRLKIGDHVEGTIPDPEPLDVAAENIPLSVLYEDDDIIAIDKPPGMVVHPAPGHYSGTLVNALLFHCKALPGIGGVERPGIVHRLDKDTSGIVVVAKTDAAMQSLSSQFKDRTVNKEYLALVKGVLRHASGIIDVPIGRHKIHRKKMSLDAKGREAQTKYVLISQFESFAYLRLKPKTGRTHQIRVHLASIGHPVLGDNLYGGKTGKGRQMVRQALHAHKLGLEHPPGKGLLLESPLPPDMEDYLNFR